MGKPTEGIPSVGLPVGERKSMELLRVESEHTSEELVSIPTSIQTARDIGAESDCAWGLRVACQERNSLSCCQYAEEAARRRDTACVPLLSEVLTPPQGFRMRLRRRQWTLARLASVNALAKISSLDALPPLARAILDPSPLVQNAAADAILPFGPDALPALTSALHTTADWPLSGMKRLVTIIGQVGTPQACVALVPVVLGGQPRSAARWDKPLRWSFNAYVGGVGAITALMLIATSSLSMAFAALVVSGLLLGFLWILVCICCITPYCLMRESYERGAIAGLAAEGLRSARNKAYLPAVVEGAFGYNRISPKPARKALLYLLPLLNADDGERMEAGTRRHLMEALGNVNNSQQLEFALVRAMEWVGTGQAARKVAWLTRRGQNSAIRDEAARILPVLQERERREQAPTTLLRPSHAAPILPEHLLRPIAATDATPAEQLLRPENAS